MINNDTRNEIVNNIVTAAKDGNQEDFEKGLQAMFSNIQDSIVAQAAEMKNASDATILAQRGVRQLTAEEKKFYENFISKAQGTTGKVMDALTGTEKVFPETIIESVMDDLTTNHPLLAAIDTMNCTGITKMFLNTDAGTAATWGKITDAIVTEITSGFKEIDLSAAKLSAFIPISQDILKLGPTWLDAYIRACLGESLALGLENGVVAGNGLNAPVGMIKSIADGVTVSTTTGYPDKTSTAVTDFSSASYGTLIAKLAKTRTGKDRPVNGLVLVCNPQDYYKLVMPATTVMNTAGQYVPNVLPVPTTIIQSAALASGKAVLGIGKNYFLGVAGNRGVEFSDDYKFVEDNRYYKTVMYGNGMAKSDTDFLYLDISKVTPAYIPIKQVTA